MHDGATPPLEPTTREAGPGVLLMVPAGRVATLELVRLRLVRPEGAAALGARAAIVLHMPAPHGTDTRACVVILPGAGAAVAEAAGAAAAIAGPATLTLETDAPSAWICTATVRARWGPDAPDE